MWHTKIDILFLYLLVLAAGFLLKINETSAFCADNFPSFRSVCDCPHPWGFPYEISFRTPISGTCFMQLCSVDNNFAITTLEGIYR